MNEPALFPTSKIQNQKRSNEKKKHTRKYLKLNTNKENVRGRFITKL